VVVPCFNDGATLPEAIESLRDQELAELVVVDDGSTDESTLGCLDALRAGGVRVVRQDNAGLPAARMRGVAETSAPYVFPLDADDALVPGSLEALADALDRRPDARLAWGDVINFGEVEMRIRMGPCLDPWKITYLNDVPTHSLIRRDALLEAGGWQLARGFEDWDLWMAFAERGWHGVYLGRPVLHYRYSTNDGRKNAAQLSLYPELYGELRSRHPSLFARRGANWRASCASPAARALFPVIDAVPFLSDWTRRRLYHVSEHPIRILQLRRMRRAGPPNSSVTARSYDPVP
jgi:glycosyltransferase involved in cell wall biosynthesis